MTRAESSQNASWQRGLLRTDNLGMGFVLMHAELECLVVSGPIKGKQHTYALLEERVPPQPAKEKDEALADARRALFLGAWAGEASTISAGGRG